MIIIIIINYIKIIIINLSILIHIYLFKYFILLYFIIGKSISRIVGTL